MLLKLFRVVWFVSVLALFATLLYGYAGWQENMVIQEESSGQISMNRDVLFYVMLAISITVNVLVYVIKSMYGSAEAFRMWFHGLVITINVFFIIALSLIGLYNSAEKFDYARIGFVIYGSVTLIVIWAAAWPVYALYQKFFLKQSV
ncbi:hypothetical protein KK083_08575 [Fulvivirgaceae bacterium PWU4]|uniref:Uncharacterized protein n=1 Tax=Chryseosolibacter histidini TaxID=2782349 RepID=A0AAP2GIB3_9BACT|nr:hypothetical protein [Chryseosolibacter histidini]MBT1696924.1 hypothetical protein [Chryseosolibacter histidini]